VKIDKLAEMSAEELRHEEERLAEQLFRFRFQIQTGNVENPSRLPQTRRDLARVKTILRERELGIERHRRSAADAEAARTAGESRRASGSRSSRASELKGASQLRGDSQPRGESRPNEEK